MAGLFRIDIGRVNLCVAGNCFALIEVESPYIGFRSSGENQSQVQKDYQIQRNEEWMRAAVVLWSLRFCQVGALRISRDA